MDQRQLSGIGTVLVCDYVGRRTEAPISSLDLESRGFTVHYLIKPPHVRELTAPAYADRLLGTYGPFADVKAVLAYCASAPIAQELVASIAVRTGATVPLVLFDAELSTARSIEEEYLLASAKLGEVLFLNEQARVPTPVLHEDLLRDRPELALRHLHEGLLQLGERAVEQGTDDPEEARGDAEAIADFYLDWLAHLIAAHNASWPAWGGAAVQVVSRDRPSYQEWPGAIATETVRIGATRDDLLRHPDVAQAVLRVLREGSGRAG
jgi:hypothetical protein